ncbi:MAG: NAD(P)H-hydrate epimerase, partial [Rubrivivax sp.]|nr:NAD(P)H-hydrate epimerase [Rubrivivax sp.]
MDAPPLARGTPLHDSATLRAVEARAAARHGDAFELMARAGQAAWRELLARWPQVQRIVVVCGPGNNGGDGYELCRYAHQSGRDARVLRIDAHRPRSELAQRACEAYRDAGGRIKAFSDGFGKAELIVDAVFGIGLSRPPDAGSAQVIDAINAAGLPVFSLDVPSGIDADAGSAPGAAVRATHTLQFIAAHPGLATGAGSGHAGSLALASLETGEDLADATPAAIRLEAADLRGWIPPRRRDAHKGDSGHVLCIGGDLGTGGAVIL